MCLNRTNRARLACLSFHSILKWRNVLLNIDTQALKSTSVRSCLTNNNNKCRRRRMLQPLTLMNTYRQTYGLFTAASWRLWNMCVTLHSRTVSNFGIEWAISSIYGFIHVIHFFGWSFPLQFCVIRFGYIRGVFGLCTTAGIRLVVMFVRILISFYQHRSCMLGNHLDKANCMSILLYIHSSGMYGRLKCCL